VGVEKTNFTESPAASSMVSWVRPETTPIPAKPVNGPDAVEVYFTDPSDLDDRDTYMAQKALADRLAAYEDRTIDLD
jgi:hypothetical protein